MPAEDSVPGSQDTREAWWAAREAGYRQRPQIRQEIVRLQAEARERAQQENVRAWLLDQRTEDGVPGAREALDEEMARQAIEVDPPEPSARDDPDQWRAFFLWIYGRDMPLNARYEAEMHRIDRGAPHDAGLAAAYYRVSYPRGFDEIELAAEREGVTAGELRRRWELPAIGSQRDLELTIELVPAADEDAALDTGLADVVTAVARHRTSGAADARSGAQGDGFADIWDAFARLRESLGLPGEHGGTEPASQVWSGPVSAAPLEDAMRGARASAAWYRDAPEWQRITAVTGAARTLLEAIRSAAGSYWNEISQDLRVRGFVRTVAARTCRTVSACAGALAGKLERQLGQQTRAWRDLTRLHRTAGTAANRIIGYQPPVADAGQIIAALSRQRQASAGPRQVISPAALAAPGFPAPFSQATPAASAAGRRQAATRTRRRLGGPQH